MGFVGNRVLRKILGKKLPVLKKLGHYIPVDVPSITHQSCVGYAIKLYEHICSRYFQINTCEYLDTSKFVNDKKKNLLLSREEKERKIKEDILRFEADNAYILAFIDLVYYFSTNRILVVYVFDGKPTPIKIPTLKKRSKQRHIAGSRCIDIENIELSELNDGDIKEYLNLKRKSINSNINYDCIRKIAEVCGINTQMFIDYEADVICSYIIKKHNLESRVVTNDSDLLLFGCDNILTPVTYENPKSKAEFRQFHIDSILKYYREKADKVINNYSKKIKFKIESKDLTRDKLLDYCILRGTSYNFALISFNKKRDKKDDQKVEKLEKDEFEEVIFTYFVLSNFDVLTLLKSLAKKKELSPDHPQYDKQLGNFKIIDNAEKIHDLVKNYYRNKDVKVPEIDIMPKEPNKEKMIELLCGAYRFTLSFVEDLYEKLLTVYQLSKNSDENKYSYDDNKYSHDYEINSDSDSDNSRYDSDYPKKYDKYKDDKCVISSKMYNWNNYSKTYCIEENKEDCDQQFYYQVNNDNNDNNRLLKLNKKKKESMFLQGYSPRKKRPKGNKL